MGEAGTSNILNDYIAGAIGGATGLVFGHPFDTTKVQLQTQHFTKTYNGTFDAIKNINKQGWSTGFFRGLGFPLFSYGVVNGVYFGVYGHTLSYLREGKSGPASMLEIYAAGCVGGAFQLLVACPVDCVKVVLQSQIPHGQQGGSMFFKGPIECSRWIIRNRGIAGMYTGMVSMAWRDIPSYGWYIAVYEWLYKVLDKSQYTDKNGIVANLLAGGTAGTICWASIIPFDCIKSRLQADQGRKYKNMMDCASQMYRQRGYRAFFDGLLVNSIRAFLVNSITFLIYSQTLKALNDHSRGQKNMI